MNNETKRDVFEVAMNHATKSRWVDYSEMMSRYDAAMPDDIPVIPEAVGDAIVKFKHKKFSLSGAISYAAVVSLSSWMTFEHEECFARAWLLGAWRVEETGEIVKFEAEK